jgi:brefeldin A-inhibited guanine nucleotide-exchange protein
LDLCIDRIFTSSHQLTGSAIVFFCKALCEQSWEEISTSNNKDHPRMYCLQRLIEISYYNMNRIRVEWSHIWMVLGEHFNNIGCYPSNAVANFALDNLRQLAVKFLELEELPSFKFQKEFLNPFSQIITKNDEYEVQVMCLECIIYIVRLKRQHLRSGWRSVCRTIQATGHDHQNEAILKMSLNLATEIIEKNSKDLILNDCLKDLVSALTQFASIRTPTGFK